MRSYRHTRRQQRKSSGDFWLSFSDLMSSLVLIIVLVMFYIIYQYFNMAEINQAEIARRQFQLDEAQAELETQQGKLTEAEEQMIAQQILLNAKQEELDDAQAVLEAQKTQLASAEGQLSEKEIEIAEQQAKLNALSAQLNQQQDQLAVQQNQLTVQQDQLSAQRDQLTAQQDQLTIQKTQLATAQNQLAVQQDQLSSAQDQLVTQQVQLAAQQTQLENQQQQIEQLVGLKTRIITSLSTALRNSNISATVDPSNGSIALESDVMFETNQYKLSERGKKFIDRFLPVYLDVLFSDEYKEYVAEVIIEGHTDSLGGYLDNLKLSQQRALAVATYVLEDGYRGISEGQKRSLRSVVTVNGRSFSDLIRDENGREDMNASRRVVFKFRLTDEQMIQQLREILEAK